MEFMCFDISLISLWWDLLSLDIKQKSSAYGSVTKFSSFSFKLYPNLAWDCKYRRMGLNSVRKMIGLNGSPWKTPLLNEKISLLKDCVRTVAAMLL